MGTTRLESFVRNASLQNANKQSLFDVQTPAAKEKLEKTSKTTDDVESFGELLARKISLPTKATQARIAKNNERRQLLYDAVVNRYGSKDKIPASVRKAMDLDKFSLTMVDGREVVKSGKPLTDRRIGIVLSSIIAADEEAAQLKQFTGLDRSQLMATLGLKATDEMPPRLKTLLLVLAGRPDLVRSGDGINSQMAKDILSVRTELLALRERVPAPEHAGLDQDVVGGNTLTFGDFRLGFSLTGNGKIKLSLSPFVQPEGRSGLDFELRETNADKTLDRIEIDIADNVALYGKDTAMELLKREGGFKDGWFTDASPRAREVGTKIIASVTGAKTSEFGACCTEFVLKLAEKALKGQIGNASSMTKFAQALSSDKLTNDAETLKLYERLNQSLEKNAKGVTDAVKMSPAKVLEEKDLVIMAKMKLFELQDLDEQIRKNTGLMKGLRLSGQRFAVNKQLNDIKSQLSSGEVELTAEDIKERADVEKQAAYILRCREAAELRGMIADVIFEADTGGADFARIDTKQLPGARFGEAMKRNQAALVKLIAHPEKFDLLPEQIRGSLRGALEAQIVDILPKEAVPQGNFKLEDLRGIWEKQAGGSSKDSILFESFIAGQLNEVLNKLSEKKEDAHETGFAELERALNVAVEKGADDIQAKVGKIFGAAVPGLKEKGDAEPPPAKVIVDKVVSDNQTLDKLVSSSMADLKSGQGAFTKQVLSTYFADLDPGDRRTMFAAMLRFAPPPDPENLEAKDLFTKDELAKYNALLTRDRAKAEEMAQGKMKAHEEELDGRLLGAILKGTGPLLLKMLQGMPVPKDNRVMSIALEDVKSNLAPIPEKVVQANLLDVVERSKGEIKSIEVTKSLGAASVGQAFLCRVTLDKTDGQGQNVVKDVVVKMLRPDVKNRLEREKECFLTAADRVSGMSETFRGQLERIMDELDLTVEARNVLDGIHNYGDGTFSNLDSMRLDPIVPPTANVMILEKAPGTTLDRYVKDMRETIANLRAPCIQSIDEETGKVTYRYPGFTAIMKMRTELVKHYADLLQKRDMLESLSLKWVSEGLYGSGFYHGDLHSGNMMVDGETNKLTVIDFGNVTKLTKDQQSAIMKMMAAAAAGKDCENLFIEGYRSLLTPAGQATLDKNLDDIKRLLAHLFADKVGGVETAKDDVGQRIAAALMQLQRLGLELPGPVYNFSQCQLRLQNSVEEVNGLMRTIRESMSGALLAKEKQLEGEDAPAGKLLRRLVRWKNDRTADLSDEFSVLYFDMMTKEDHDSYDNHKKLTEVTEKARAEGEGWVAYLLRTHSLSGGEMLNKLLDFFPKSDAETEKLAKDLVRGIIPSLDSYLYLDDINHDGETLGPLLKAAQNAYNKAENSSPGSDAFENEEVKAKLKVFIDAYTTARKRMAMKFLLFGDVAVLKDELSVIPEINNMFNYERNSDWRVLNKKYRESITKQKRKDPDNENPNIKKEISDELKNFLDTTLTEFVKKLARLREEYERTNKDSIYAELMRGGKIMKDSLRPFSKHVGDVVSANVGSSVWQLGLGNAIWYHSKFNKGN